MSDETVKYQNETERRKALEAIQEDETIDIDEKLRKIGEITNAEVAEQEPDPQYTDDELYDEEDNETPPEEGDGTEKKHEEGNPDQLPAKEKKNDGGEPENRHWVITEDDIPKETWYDRVERKEKPYVTQKNPKDLIQSYVHGQKRIHWLEDIQLPQQKEHEYRRGRTEAEKEWQRKLDEKEAEYKQKIDELTKQSASQKNETPNASANLADILKQLNEIDPGDALERSEDIAKLNSQALTAALNQINSMGDTIKEMQSGKAQPRPAQEKQSATQRQAAQQQPPISQVWENACREMDQFVSSEDCPDDLRINRPYNQVTEEALRFQRELAQLHTAQLGQDGRLMVKPANEIGNAEMEAATAAYLTGLPQLMQRVQQYGFQEPQEFRTWIELDQIDGLRTGFLRDPSTKQWVQNTSIQHPDYRSALDYYYRSTGKAQQVKSKEQQRAVDDFASAITRRDSRVVQMDTSKAMSGDHNAITERQAWDILDGENSIDREDAIREAWGGKTEKLELLNQALERLGQPTIPVS